MSLRQILMATALASGLSTAAVIDLPIINDNSYQLVEAKIGTPAKTYRLLFDTGSATSWVVDDKCAVDCTNNTPYKRVGYNVDTSSTGNLTGRWGEIEYFGGTTAGLIASDLMNLGGVSSRQSFVAASKSSWLNLPADGFLGLAFNSIIVGAADTVMTTFMPKLDASVFGIYYGSEGKNGGKGRLTLGKSRASEYTEGKLATVPITSRDGQFEVWSSVVNTVTGTRQVGGKKVKKDTDYQSGRVVFDTGAGRTSLPKGKAEAVYESIGMNLTALTEGTEKPLCSNFNSTWSVSFSFGSGKATVVTLTGDILARPGFAGQEKYCWPPFDEGDMEGLTLVGKDFLSAFYTVWDFGSKKEANFKPTLSFGKLKRGK